MALTVVRPGSSVPPGRRPSWRRRGLWLTGLLVAALVAAALSWRLAVGGPPGPPPASVGNAANMALPAAVLDAPLVDQQGRAAPLSSFAGHVVVLVPFLTACQEVCPLTTAALLEVRRSVASAGLAGRVDIVEVTVDPGRDVPSRLADYGRLTGATWPMLTSSPAVLQQFWKALGVYATPVPEGSPPGIDWQTGKPSTYDVDHSDGFFVLGPDLHERFATASAPDLQGHSISGPLTKMLDSQGIDNLRHPAAGSWTVAQALQAIGWVAGRSVSTGS
ncbi:MAG: SCO family protein [Acidimicrobiales bacterium]